LNGQIKKKKNGESRGKKLALVLETNEKETQLDLKKYKYLQGIKLF
jgi:hypothetical protein